MKNLITTVREKVNDKRCLVENGKLSKSGCKVSMEGAPQPVLRVIIDFDKPGSPLNQNETRCDYLIVAQDNNELIWVIPLELKKGGLDVSEIVGQLEAGTGYAEEVVPEKKHVKFCPVVACGKKAERYELKKKENKIRFRGGKPKEVELISCSGKLFLQLNFNVPR